MSRRRRYNRLDEVDEEIEKLIQILPRERHLEAFLRAFPHETPLRVANIWSLLVLRLLRERGSGDPTKEEIFSFLSELSGRPVEDGSYPPQES